MSKAELLLPTTTTFLPTYASGPGCADEWCWSPRNTSWPGRTGMFGLPDIPVASTSCLGRSVSGLPSRSISTVQSAGLLGVRRTGGDRGGPVRHLHHLRVGLQPVADLVLRREDRPVVGELQVGQVVVPDRVVQAQRLVAAAPLVAGPRVLVDHQTGYAELSQPGAEGDPTLAATDDQHVGVGADAELGVLPLAALEPRRPVPVGTVLGSHRTRVTARLLVALELVHRGEEGPRLRLAVLLDQAQQAVAAADCRLEREPRRRHPVALGRRLVGDEGRRVGPVKGLGQQVGNARPGSRRW